MKKKICFVVAIPGTATAFLTDHISALSKDYSVYIAGNINSKDEIARLNVIDYYHVDIQRQITLVNDLKAVWQLWRYFRKMKFDAVHSVTPKAGLITALAGFLAGIKHRIHIYTGQVWATLHGGKRRLLMTIDRLIAKLDNHILIDGNSQRQFLIDNRIISKDRSQVLASGSICGVNIERFTPTQECRDEKRKELRIKGDRTVFVFMGRLNRDKGLYELLSAFDQLAAERNDVYLLLFGNDEEEVAATFGNYKNLKEHENFLYYGRTSSPQTMMQAGDVLVLPTYREGFGSSVIEAACLGLSTITSDAYGVLDASVPGVTGLQCKVGDVESLFIAMKELAKDKDKTHAMGQRGRERVLKEFTGEIVVNAWMEYYHNMLG